MLAELDLLQHTVLDEDAISIGSLDDEQTNAEEKETNYQVCSDTHLTVPNQKVGKHVRSLSDITDSGISECSELEKNTSHINRSDDRKMGDFQLSVEIIETGRQESKCKQ